LGENNRLEDLILIGRVIKSHGLTGLLRIVSYAQSKETFLRAGSVFLKTNQNELHEGKVLSIRPHRSWHLLRLSGLGSREHFSALKGAEILIRRETLQEKQEDEFYWFELLGLEVYLTTGDYVGVLSEVFPTGSNDVYVVRDRGREYLIPGIYEVVKEIDLSGNRMIISPLKGLLDLP
jgi:16S rRNA processing protein RimM